MEEEEEEGEEEEEKKRTPSAQPRVRQTLPLQDLVAVPALVPEPPVPTQGGGARCKGWRGRRGDGPASRAPSPGRR